MTCEYHENTPDLWGTKLPYPPAHNGHKYDRGHVLMLGGASHMTGAIRMAAAAAMRVGAGLCTIVTGKDSLPAYQRDDAAPHILYRLADNRALFPEFFSDDERLSAALLGPGAGLDEPVSLKRAVLGTLVTGKPVVLDADALSVFADEPETLIEALHENCVLTPHEGEFTRVFPYIAGQGSRLEQAQKAAADSGAILVLKGAETLIAALGRVPLVNKHASPWLATAGAGDVLAGMIAGLLGQGMKPFDAASAAVWMHGEAALRFGVGLTAPDIIDEIPGVLRDFT